MIICSIKLIESLIWALYLLYHLFIPYVTKSAIFFLNALELGSNTRLTSFLGIGSNILTEKL